MRLRRRGEVSAATTTATGAGRSTWDGVGSRPAAKPVIKAPRAADLVPAADQAHHTPHAA
jgi:hypothetical protein